MANYFIATTLNQRQHEGITRLLAILQRRLGTKGLSYTSLGDTHCTLKFLGPMAWSAEVVRSVMNDVAALHGPFAMDLNGVAYFGSARKPAVLYAQVTQGCTELTSLAHALTERLELHGIERETHVYTPHITLARVRRELDQEQLQLALHEAESVLIERCVITDIALMKGREQPNGETKDTKLRYEVVCRVPLQGSVGGRS